ncbi:SRPBCC family protein [Candidatus Poriferisodalis sp.]|uniref:SRPBCC family protein n=1 Tax=Candidatus Poriferisodalis sp. TaxID=3101277 RepID=UPI003B025D4F
MGIEVSIDIPASPQEVWDYAADLARNPEWMADAESITFTSARTEGVGTTFDCVTKVGPMQTTDQIEVVEWDPPHVLGIQHQGAVRGVGRFTLSPTAEGTHFTWSEDLILPWYFGARIGQHTASIVLERVWRRSLRNLRTRILEQQQGATGHEPGPLLGMGRDSEIRAYGPHIIRVSLRGRDLGHEAEAMRHVRTYGYPAPRVIEQPDDHSMVMERLSGPTMLDELAAKPWLLSRHVKGLAQLHRQLGDVPAPADWVKVSSGSSVVHLDLQPDNVKLTPDRPVVIDWSNAAAGETAFDAALTYVRLRTAAPDNHPAARAVINAFRTRFARAFLKEFGTDAILSRLRAAADLRLLDRNLHPNEREAVFALARGELD